MYLNVFNATKNCCSHGQWMKLWFYLAIKCLAKEVKHFSKHQRFQQQLKIGKKYDINLISNFWKYV